MPKVWGWVLIPCEMALRDEQIWAEKWQHQSRGKSDCRGRMAKAICFLVWVKTSKSTKKPSCEAKKKGIQTGWCYMYWEDLRMGSSRKQGFYEGFGQGSTRPDLCSAYGSETCLFHSGLSEQRGDFWLHLIHYCISQLFAAQVGKRNAIYWAPLEISTVRKYTCWPSFWWYRPSQTQEDSHWGPATLFM